MMLMNAWLDQVLVAALVLGSAIFACSRLGPAPLRLWMRRQWARLRGKPLPEADLTGCAGCANGQPMKPRAETQIAAGNIRKFERPH
jgi:hypothetical protein